MRIICIFTSLLCLLSAPMRAKGEIPGLIPVKGSTTLSYSTIFSLCQDEYGTIWMNTNSGLIRYNGNRFERTGHMLMMQPIYSDKRGHIYMQTNLALIEYDIHTDTQTRIEIPSGTNSRTINVGKQGLWIGSGQKIFRYMNGIPREYVTIDDPSPVIITSVLECRDGSLLAGTRGDGVFRIDVDRKVTRLVASNSEVGSIYEDSRGNIWIGTWNDGAYIVRPDGGVEQISTDGPPGRRLPSDFVRAFCEDKDHNIWIGTMQGLYIMDVATGNIEHSELPLATSRQSIWCILKDDQQGMWVGTFYGGVYYSPPSVGIFRRMALPAGESGESYMINAITEDKRGDLWICSDGLGLIHLAGDGSRRIIRNPYSNKLKTVRYDQERDALWIGTHLGGLNRYDIREGRWVHYDLSDGKNENIKQIVNAILPWEGKFFLGMFDRVLLFDPATGNCRQPENLTVNSPVHSLAIDDGGNLWIAAERLYKYNIAYARQFSYSIYEPDARLKVFTSVYTDPQGEVWGTTLGDGFFHLENQEAGLNGRTIGLENDFVSCLGLMDDGRMIVGTHSGVSLFDETNGVCVNYNFTNGFPLSSMRNGCIFRRKNGDYLLGGVDGVVVLEPGNMTASQTLPNLRIDHLKINNRDSAAIDGVAGRAPFFAKQIKLAHDQSTISIEIADDDYTHESSFVYEYQLSGVDKQAVRFNPEFPVTYNSLPPGTYRFSVWVSSQLSGERSEPVTLDIRITPPWYSAWYARLFYALVILAIIFGVVYFFWQRMLFRTTLEQQEMNSRFKSRFFTQVSHEFRTPLTLIIGQLELLSGEPGMRREARKRVMDAHRHSMKMQELITQLLDFEKQYQGHARLNVRRGDLVEFLRVIYASFEAWAVSHDITFELETGERPIMLWFDEMQLQKVFGNLLSNAFKFTPEGGRITVRAAVSDDRVEVSVEDTGIGIRPESLGRIFDNYYQDNDGNSPKHNPGTGIGLALAQKIAEMHHGTISAKSTFGHGSCFTVGLPLGDGWFEGDEAVIRATDKEIIHSGAVPEADEDFMREAIRTQNERFAKKPSLLIVEDDPDMRTLLYGIFGAMYEVEQAGDGAEGYRKACDMQPDLIISDVMMPEMDGRELCSMLKKNFLTSHIPIVLLTAQSSAEQNVEGLKCGADDYVTKPFNVKILVTRCNNLLYNRQVLREKFLAREVSGPDTVTTNEQDRKFFEKMLAAIDSRLDDGTISVPALCRDMGMSKTMLTIKIKGITGQSPGEFIQATRLKKAAYMIRNFPERTISEIAYDLGFSSPKYFTDCFKRQFAVTPSQMREENTNGERITG